MIEIGKHRLLCGDITQGAVEAVMCGEKADVVYSDPPWGPGNQKYWHTMNNRGSVPRTSWEKFLVHFVFACIRNARKEAPIFVEMGTRWVDELDSVMLSAGQRRVRRWNITYSQKRLPLTLSLYGHTDVDVDMPDTHGKAVTASVLQACVSPDSIVLDPCTGLGMTARYTHMLGGQFRGTELNPKRLERTCAWLQSRSK